MSEIKKIDFNTVLGNIRGLKVLSSVFIKRTLLSDESERNYCPFCKERWKRGEGENWKQHTKPLWAYLYEETLGDPMSKEEAQKRAEEIKKEYKDQCLVANNDFEMGNITEPQLTKLIQDSYETCMSKGKALNEEYANRLRGISSLIKQYKCEECKKVFTFDELVETFITHPVLERKTVSIFNLQKQFADDYKIIEPRTEEEQVYEIKKALGQK